MIDQHTSLAEKFVKKGFWLYLFTFLMAPLGYIVKIIISGNISIEELGILYGVISLITLLSAINDLGISQSMNYFIPRFVEEKRYDKVKSIITFGIAIQFLSSLFFVFLFFIGSDYLAVHYFESPIAKEVLQIFAFFFLGINIFQTINTFFMAVQNTFFNKITEFLRMFGILIFVIGTVSLNQGNILYFSYSWLLGLTIGLIVALIIFWRKFYLPYLKKEKLLREYSFYKEIFHYSFFLFLGAQAAVILSQMDMQMIIYFLSTKEAGYYTNYLSIIGIPFILFAPLLQFLLPVFSELFSQKKSEKISEIKNIFSEVLISSSLFISVFFCIFAVQISTLLFGKEYIISGYILYYSIPFLCFILLLQLNFVVFGAIGKVKERFYITAWALLFNALLNIILIKMIGVYGAALATALGWVFIFIVSEIRLEKIYRTRYNLGEIFINIVFLIGVSLLSIILLSYLPFENISRIYLIFMLLGYMIFWSIFYIIPNRKKFLFLKKEIENVKGRRLFLK